MNRLRGAGAADLLALCGFVAAIAGVAVVGDGLVAAAQGGGGVTRLGWEPRLVAGLWRFRLEHALWFTAGAVAFVAGRQRGALLGGRRDAAARLMAGMALGLAVVAVAVALAATDVALAGGVGAGVGALHPSGRERIATWLLQLLTAGAAALVWLSIAAWLTAPEVAGAPAERTGGNGDESPATGPAPAAAMLDPAPALAPAPPPRGSAGERAQQLYRDRLAFSPRRDAARRLVLRIEELERQGLGGEADAACEELAQMDVDRA